jgi:pyruvate dehydrogenase E2 component (dihydrolipoamide acetyltransferase)
MPRQGQSVESCILTQFFVKEGEKVTAGTLLFAYETDKASFEEEAHEDGVILAWFYEEGDEIPVLSNVGVIGKEGESVEEFRNAGGDLPTQEIEVPEKTAETVVEKEIASVGSDSAMIVSGSEEVFISPRAKKLAMEEGINYSGLLGSGAKGRIIEADILKALVNSPRKSKLAKKLISEQGMAAGATGSGLAGAITSADLVSGSEDDSRLEPIPNIRKLIAKAMHSSLQNSAQLTHHLGADARKLLETREKVKDALNDGYHYNLTLNDMICHAVIQSLKQFPRVNAHYLGNNMRLFNNVHLGVAVDTERGLMVPAVRNADKLSIQQLSEQVKSLADACKKGNVDPDLLSPNMGTFTVSNLGNYGVEMFTPIINLPQVAILGVNTIVPRPKDLGNGVYAFVPYLGLSLTYDHQAVDGGEATRFVKTIATEIENIDINL